MPSIDELRRHYARLSVDELQHLALYEASQLTREALELLATALRERQAPREIVETVTTLVRGLEAGEFDALVASFRASRCPTCGVAGAPLNAIALTKVDGIGSGSRAWVEVACPICLQRAARFAKKATLRRGWLRFLGGPIEVVDALLDTVGALRTNAKALDASRSAAPTPELLGFVRENVGAILADQKNPGTWLWKFREDGRLR